MGCKREGLLGSMVRSIVSVVYMTVVWLTRLSHPMPNSKAMAGYYHHLLLSICSLIGSAARHLNHGAHVAHSYVISSRPASFSPSSTSSLLKPMPHPSLSSPWSSAMGDLIGTDSGVYMSGSEDGSSPMPSQPVQNPKPYPCKPNQRSNTKREYPPPIPSLLQTGLTPRVLTRHYGDGRLVLTEERVKHYEYFEAHRTNGRLVLNLNIITVKSCSRDGETGEDEEVEDTQNRDSVKDEREREREREGGKDGRVVKMGLASLCLDKRRPMQCGLDEYAILHCRNRASRRNQVFHPFC